MKTAVITFFLSIFLLTSCAELEQLAMSGGGPLTETEVVNGLKQALEIGAQRAAGNASEEGGFLNNELIFIAFPSEAQQVERTLRGLGAGSLVDDFVRTMNRSAELAAREAAPIFGDAVRAMTIEDAFTILRGEPNAATLYFRGATSDRLENAFTPVIESALNQTPATSLWTEITTMYNNIPFVNPVETDLAAYTTQNAIDGLFTLLEQEEAAIRQDPVKRTTDLLRRVFGHSSLN